MNSYFLQVNSNVTGGYFSSEQIDLLSIIQCNTPEELVSFVNDCIQIKDIYKNHDLSKIIENIGLEDAKRRVFKNYQDSMVLHDSELRVIIENSLNHLEIKNEDIEIIINAVTNLSMKEAIDYINKYIKNNYSDRSDEILYVLNNFRPIERDQNKSEDQYEEISVLNDNLDDFDTMILGSGRIHIVNGIYGEVNKEKKYCFDRVKQDLDFAYKNGKCVRYHSLLVQEDLDRLFDDKGPEEIKEILKNYVKESIDFINKYNATHKINVNGENTGIINSVILFNEIVSFWKNENGEYFNIWEEKYGITVKDLAEVFEYARQHKPDGVNFIYNEPFLEDEEKRNKVFDVLRDFDKYSPGLIDTLGSQMHIKITEEDDGIRRCFDDFRKLQEETGKKIQITEFGMSLDIDQAYKVFKEKPELQSQIYEIKTDKLKKISNIINQSGVHLDGISYWSLTDGVDYLLEQTRSKLLEEGKIGSIDEIPTVCGGLYPTHKKLIQNKQLSPAVEAQSQIMENQQNVETLHKHR